MESVDRTVNRVISRIFLKQGSVCYRETCSFAIQEAQRVVPIFSHISSNRQTKADSATQGRQIANHFRTLLIATTLIVGIDCHKNVQAQQAKPAGVAPGTVEQFQLWNQFSVIKNITPGMRGFVEIGPRFRTRQLNQTPATFALPPTGFQLDRFVSGLWLVFPFNPSNTLRVGVRALHNTATQTRSFDETETRFTQDHIGAYPIGDVIFATRARLEERLIPNRQSPAFRLRTRLGFEFPLDQQRKWWFILNDELFFNLNDAGAPNLRPGLSENRVIAGLRSRVAPGIGLEFLYQHDWLNRDTAFDDINHCLLINISFDIDQIEQANARRVDSKKTALINDPPPIKFANLPVDPETKAAELSTITNKSDLLAQSRLSAIDLIPQEDFAAVLHPSKENLLATESTSNLSEVLVVASREEALSAQLHFSMLMNSFDSEGAEGSP